MSLLCLKRLASWERSKHVDCLEVNSTVARYRLSCFFLALIVSVSMLFSVRWCWLFSYNKVAWNIHRYVPKSAISTAETCVYKRSLFRRHCRIWWAFCCVTPVKCACSLVNFCASVPLHVYIHTCRWTTSNTIYRHNFRVTTGTQNCVWLRVSPVYQLQQCTHAASSL